MRSSEQHQDHLRCARFETFEDRLVLSAQPAGDFFIDELMATAPEQQYGEVAPALAGVHTTTGVAYARSAFGFDGAGQTVAVIDSGIAYDHYALGGGFGAGYRVVGGWDFTEENDANPYDDGPAGFHGTHVAGIIGSSDARYTGVAPGVDLVALRVFNDQGAGYFEWVEKALRWVHENRNSFRNPITTVNLSLGTNWNSNSLPSWAILEDEFAQLKADGIFIAVSAGNSFATYNTAGLSYPAVSPYVVPVASVGATGSLSSFSQRDSRVIAAPGERITSTVPDHVFGSDGVPNDFASVSGTSMASPYLAGSSAVLREAMNLLGYQNVTQDTLYNHLRSTADSVYDSITRASYARLNLQRALDAIMPADEYGSTVATAQSLGTLGGSRTIAGMINRLDDLDYFRFTASQTGVAQFTVNTTGKLIANWQATEAGTKIDGKTFSMNVVAGQSYTFGLGTKGGIGNYTIDAALQATTTTINWGVVSSSTFANQRIAGESWYQITATRNGLLTVEASFAHAAGNVNLEIYNANRQVLASSNSTTNRERVDVTATAGQTFYVRATGANSAVDFRLTNLVTVSGSQVEINGTAGNDTFTFAAGKQHTLSVNGVDYQFDGSRVTAFKFRGGAGNDSITLTGSTASDTATARVGSVDLVSRAYRAGADSVETIVVNGGGSDTARLFDSAGDDVLVSRPESSTLSGRGFSNTVAGFQRVYAYATAGGNDVARLYDSAGDDRLVARPQYSVLSGNGFYNYAWGFDRVQAYATAGGAYDRAWMYDSSGNDRYEATANTNVMSGAGYHNSAQGFSRVYAYATAGGRDTAHLYAAPSNTQIVTRTDYSIFSGTDFYNYSRGFSQTFTYNSTAASTKAAAVASRADNVMTNWLPPVSNITSPATMGVQFNSHWQTVAPRIAGDSTVSPAAEANRSVFNEYGTGSNLLDAPRTGQPLVRYSPEAAVCELPTSVGPQDTQHHTALGALEVVFHQVGQWDRP
jgi:subtilisin family serine protease